MAVTYEDLRNALNRVYDEDFEKSLEDPVIIQFSNGDYEEVTDIKIVLDYKEFIGGKKKLSITLFGS